MSYEPKTYYYKVYDYTGLFVGTWGADVISDPSFRMIINSGQGELKVRLARPLSDYGEDVDVAFNNKVELYCVDKDVPNGLLIYSGYISDYQPVVTANDEYVEVTVLGYVTELELTTFVDTNLNTAKLYTATDPSTMVQQVIAQAGTHITAGYIAMTGITRSYSFNNMKCSDLLNEIRNISPVGWYWYVGPSNALTFKQKSATADHTFIIGKHLTSINAYKTIRDLYNAVRFIGGTPTGAVQLYKKYEDTVSINRYGRREYVWIDQNVAVAATADAMANDFLTANSLPFVRATMTILDNNGDDQERGYDIESIKPGDTCKVLDPDATAGAQSYALNQVMLIQTVQYDGDTVTLELTKRAPWVAKRIQDIYRDMNGNVLVSTPTSVNGEGVNIPGFDLGNETFGDPTNPKKLTALNGALDAYDALGNKTINAGKVSPLYLNESDVGGATLWANMLTGFINPVSVLNVTNRVVEMFDTTIQFDYVKIPFLQLGEVVSFTYMIPSYCRGRLVTRASDGALMYCDGTAWKEVKFV
jgi:hypothetical protein